MLIKLKSLSPVLVTIRSMSVPICNRFHATRANSDKITTFYRSRRLRRSPAPVFLNLGGRDLDCWNFVAIQCLNVRCIQKLRKIY